MINRIMDRILRVQNEQPEILYEKVFLPREIIEKLELYEPPYSHISGFQGRNMCGMRLYPCPPGVEPMMMSSSIQGKFVLLSLEGIL